ncbi:MAG: hypothetical protein VYD19_07185 [Myxococcota bacterium]|nr:hypothetical protein [Myxococcota bacterium]
MRPLEVGAQSRREGWVEPPLTLWVVLILTLSALGCSTPIKEDDERFSLQLTLAPISLGLRLPGGWFQLQVTGALAEAESELTLLRGDRRDPLTLRVDDAGTYLAQLPQELEAGPLRAELIFSQRLDAAQGEARADFEVEVVHALAPRWGPAQAPLPESLHLITPAPVGGAQLLIEGEGESRLSLEGMFTPEGGLASPVSLQLPLQFGADRGSATLSLPPTALGLQPGSFVGQGALINESPRGVTQSELRPLSFTLLPPRVDEVSPLSLSRGQRVTFSGAGFLGADEGGFTLLELEGELSPFLASDVPRAVQLTLSPDAIDSTSLMSSLTVTYNLNCDSDELGGEAGLFRGQLQPTVSWQGGIVEGEARPIELVIAPTKQVVYLRFLPAFTDSLRLFGLRNLSAAVIDRIIELVERDYTGINLELRLEAPSDFLDYSTVEIGGADPNRQKLFGLDNTTGLDRCNQRLDDQLAGQNADSGGSYGGVFVESFLQLSPRRGDNPLADPLFDEIFDPVMSRPASASDLLSGPRQDEVHRALEALASLVSNTLTHEIGHSLGLPAGPAGCGPYHNAPGPRQIMDCGQDRPFLERVGLDPEGPAVWTFENRTYLEQILPL